MCAFLGKNVSSYTRPKLPVYDPRCPSQQKPSPLWTGPPSSGYAQKANGYTTPGRTTAASGAQQSTSRSTTCSGRRRGSLIAKSTRPPKCARETCWPLSCLTSARGTRCFTSPRGTMRRTWRVSIRFLVSRDHPSYCSPTMDKAAALCYQSPSPYVKKGGLRLD